MLCWVVLSQQSNPSKRMLRSTILIAHIANHFAMRKTRITIPETNAITTITQNIPKYWVSSVSN